MSKRGFRVGDRVVLKDKMTSARREEVVRRGLPFDTGGYISAKHPGRVAEVAFVNERCAFVREEDLRLLSTVEENVYRKEEARSRSRLRAAALATGAYYTPETVEEAYRLGNGHGFRNEAHMERASFLVTAGEHLYPESLWGAYRRGYRVGRRQRLIKQGDLPGGKLPPAVGNGEEPDE